MIMMRTTTVPPGSYRTPRRRKYTQQRLLPIQWKFVLLLFLATVIQHGLSFLLPDDAVQDMQQQQRSLQDSSSPNNNKNDNDNDNDTPVAITATTTYNDENEQQSPPNNIMTDQTIRQSVEIWCNNAPLATQYFGPISQWNTSQVTNFRGLFRKQRFFNDDISNWETSRATSMAGMFEQAMAFDQDLSRWNTENVVSMSAMFADATAFTGTQGGNSMAHWKVEKVTRMDRMFQNAVSFLGDLSGWRPVSCHHVANMFDNAISYRGDNGLADWDTSSFRDLTGMFKHAIRFQGNISFWNTSSAVEMDEMFSGATSFSTDISRFDTSKVITMAEMFRKATRFTGQGHEGGIKRWNVANVRNFYGMFENNPSFDCDIQAWQVSSARSMERMFFNATAFGKTQPFQETVTEQYSDFKLLCWELPSSQVKVENMFCGSSVRFDPCCASQTQMQTSCCNRFCFNTSTICAHPEHDKGKANQYSVASSTLDRDPEDDNTIYISGNEDYESHIRGHQRPNQTQAGGTKLPVVAIVFIVIVSVALLSCICGCRRKYRLLEHSVLTVNP